MIKAEGGGWKVRDHIVVVGHSLVAIRSKKGKDMVREGLISGSGGAESIHGNGIGSRGLFLNVNTSKCG